MYQCPYCFSINLQQCSPPDHHYVDIYCLDCGVVIPLSLLVYMSIEEPLLVLPEGV